MTTGEGGELRGTDNVQGQVYEHIFAKNRGSRFLNFQILFSAREKMSPTAYCFLRKMFFIECSLVRLNE